MQLERTAQVWGITGNLGGGKTLSAVQVAVQAMQSGYFVATNIELCMDAICRYCEGDWPRELYRRIDLEADDPNSWPVGDPRGTDGGRRVLIIIDEVAEWFDQFSSTSPAVKRFLSWLRHSSKRSQDVFLVVQRREYLAKSLRILIARWLWVEDLAVYRVPKLRVRIPFCGGMISRTIFDRYGNCVQRTEFASKKKWGKFYVTAQILSGTPLGVPYNVPSAVFDRAEARTTRFALVLALAWAVLRLL